MKLTIERANYGFIIDSPERDKWEPDIKLPWIATTGEAGDETDSLIDLLWSITNIFDPNAKIKIERVKENGD